MELTRYSEDIRRIMNVSPTTSLTVVFGLGATGLSVARFLAARGEAFSVIDTRESPPARADYISEFGSRECRFGDLSSEVLNGAQRLVVSPGLPLDHPLIVTAGQRGIEVLGDVELFVRHAAAPIVAVTGSNGKSTVVSLVTEILNQAGKAARCGGNIGTPALDLLLGEAPDYYVLELSSFQLETVSSLAAAVACVVNVSPDHMDRYADVESYARTKCSIYDKAARAIINADDAYLAAARPHGERITFGSAASGADYRLLDSGDGLALGTPDGYRFDCRDIALRGRHNLFNVLAALAITDPLGVDRAAQETVLRSFETLPHRTEIVAARDGIEWIDDSKGTNVGATHAAIVGLLADRNGVLIAGGVAKDADFSVLRGPVAARVHDVVLIGRDAEVIAQALDGACPIHRAESLSDAVALAASLAKRGDTVLFSPACASFDMFDNYIQRGEAFQRAVGELLLR